MSSHDGDVQNGPYPGSFEAVQDYFQRRHCRHCTSRYAAEGIQLVREEPGAYVVRITCSKCHQPLGTALIGLSKTNDPFAGQPAKQEAPLFPTDWSKRDIERLSNQPAISYDDVLNAHRFVQGLGDDWSANLPKISRLRQQPIRH
jgi:hypothetical protein